MTLLEILPIIMSWYINDLLNVKSYTWPEWSSSNGKYILHNLFCTQPVWTTIENYFSSLSFSLLSSGRLYVVMPVTFSNKVSSSHWRAYIDPEVLDLQNLSIFISSPASASVGCYRLKLCLFTQHGQKSCMTVKFTLLCNPWCRGEYKPSQLRQKPLKVNIRFCKTQRFLVVYNVTAAVS